MRMKVKLHKRERRARPIIESEKTFEFRTWSNIPDNIFGVLLVHSSQKQVWQTQIIIFDKVNLFGHDELIIQCLLLFQCYQHMSVSDRMSQKKLSRSIVAYHFGWSILISNVNKK